MTDFPQASRTSDPVSSHMAEAEINSTGTRETQCGLVLNAVRNFPDCTAKELWREFGGDRYTFSRRLPDLRHKGLVENGEMRKCLVSKRMSQTWIVVVKQPELFGER